MKWLSIRKHLCKLLEYCTEVCEDMPFYRKLFKIMVKLTNEDVFGVYLLMV